MAFEVLCALAKHIRNGTFGFQAGHMHGTFLKFIFLGLGQGCNSVVGCLLNMCETLGSNLSTVIKFSEHHAPSRQLYKDPHHGLKASLKGA